MRIHRPALAGTMVGLHAVCDRGRQGMDIEIVNEYPAPLAAVFAAFGDPDFLVDRSKSLGHVPVEVVECDASQGGLRVVYHRRVPLTVPRFARRVLTPHATVTQKEIWEPDADGYSCRFEARATGIPGHVEGTAELRARNDGCAHLIHGEVIVDLPVLGGRIAALLAADTERVIAEEHAYGVAAIGAES